MSLEVSIKKKFKGFSLDVNFRTNGEYLGILGASGSGKSLTLKCIAGVETPDEGRIVLNNKVLYDSKKNVNIIPQNRNIGYMFQNYALFPNMSRRKYRCRIKAVKRKKIKTNELMKLFRLEGRNINILLIIRRTAAKLLARIIAYEPDVLLLDEPFPHWIANLKVNFILILDLLKLYNGEVLIVTHSKDRFTDSVKILPL